MENLEKEAKTDRKGKAPSPSKVVKRKFVPFFKKRKLVTRRKRTKVKSIVKNRKQTKTRNDWRSSNKWGIKKYNTTYYRLNKNTIKNNAKNRRKKQKKLHK